MNRTGKVPRSFPRTSGRPLEGLGLLFALVLAVVATVVVLIAPEHQWGPQMWPFYLGTAAVLLWVAIDLWNKLRDRPADSDDTPAADFADKRETPDRSH